jgi:mono/diheme cytochrome c family protein
MRLLAVIGILAIVAVIGAAVYFLGGFYNVAGTQPQPDFVASTIFRVRVASIDRHASETPSVSLDDPALVQAGARAFTERGCVNCHGGPGVKWAKFSEGLHPSPPDLKEIVNGIEPRQLFWVIRNGIDMTGMPSFGPIGVPDPEIWSIVAFLKKLPSVSDQDFKTWSAPATGKTTP